MAYKEYKGIDLPQVGNEILEFWKQNKIFEQSVTSRDPQRAFTFFEGPPSANGTPGIHHVMARTVKDIFCRYKTLKGFQVRRKGGWDTHGLPVELQVEKELGIIKEDIGKKISIEDYNQKCREAVMKYTNQWNNLTESIGYWVDLKNPYITYDSKYIESCWYLLKQLYNKKMLYKGYTIQPYSPAAGTGLSSHELNQPGTYKDVKDTSIVAQFEVLNECLVKLNQAFGTQANDVPYYFLAWTTTPWTLPSNAALAVGEKIEYVLVKSYNPYTFKQVNLVLAKALLGKYFSEKALNTPFEDYKQGDKLIPAQILGSCFGKQLIDIEYHQLMPYVKPLKPAFRVIAGDFVSTEDGTGIVHIAPTFGADDARVAKLADIPAITITDEDGNESPLVDKQGKFVPQMYDSVYGFAGEYVKEAYLTEHEKSEELKKQQLQLQSLIAKLEKYITVDEKIALKLKLENKAFKVEKYEHSYPHCWRTDKPVLYYPLDSWFIRTTAAKERLVALNKTINWKPESTGTGRFGNWLENLVDWNLSRSRYWGTPLPVWRTEDGKEEICIGSLKELFELIQTSNSKGVLTSAQIEKNNLFVQKCNNNDTDLHRPYVDYITLVSETGKTMTRETDLIDVWFDSGAMPYAQWGYMGDDLTLPFGKDEFNAFPADFISEGVDQTRGWFFTLHAISGMLFDKIAFKNVVSTGLVLDKNGNKMSKRLGNVINPFETIDKYGPDATRWYMITNSPPWDNLKFNLEGIGEVQRRFFGTLHNTYAFFALYANLDKFKFEETSIPLEKRTESDRWILSKLNSLIASCDASFADYEPTKAARDIQDFVVDDLSNWYVRLNRKRFWKGEYNEDKIAAYQTLYTCLQTIAKLASPIAPFYCEKLFLDLNSVSGLDNVASVHLSLFPEVNSAAIDKDLEQRMDLAQKISSLVHSIRKANSIKVRQPLQRMLIPVINPKIKTQIEAVEDLILSEVNVKKIEYIDDTSGVLIKKVKPNFKNLGKSFGAKMKDVAAAINAMNKDDITKIEREGKLQLSIANETATITLEDLEISSQDIPGWLVATEAGVTVALDINISEELKKEGIARDIVNRVQNLRKDMGMEVQDKIKITVEKKNDLINSALLSNKEYICRETQALTLDLSDKLSDGMDIEIDDETLTLKIEK